jgi:hypothetical protein
VFLLAPKTGSRHSLGPSPKILFAKTVPRMPLLSLLLLSTSPQAHLNSHHSGQAPADTSTSKMARRGSKAPTVEFHMKTRSRKAKPTAATPPPPPPPKIPDSVDPSFSDLSTSPDASPYSLSAAGTKRKLAESSSDEPDVLPQPKRQARVKSTAAVTEPTVKTENRQVSHSASFPLDWPPPSCRLRSNRPHECVHIMPLLTVNAVLLVLVQALMHT